MALRAKLVREITDAIWSELERQAAGEYPFTVDRLAEQINSTDSEVNMGAVGKIVVDLLTARLKVDGVLHLRGKRLTACGVDGGVVATVDLHGQEVTCPDCLRAVADRNMRVTPAPFGRRR